MPAKDAPTRKLIGFDPVTWHAVQVLAHECGKSVQDLAEEAFADLLKKHRRPVTLKEALTQSARQQAANDERPGRTRRSARRKP